MTIAPLTITADCEASLAVVGKSATMSRRSPTPYLGEKGLRGEHRCGDRDLVGWDARSQRVECEAVCHPYGLSRGVETLPTRLDRALESPTGDQKNRESYQR